MRVIEFKHKFDRVYEMLERFDELDRTDVIITKASGKTLFLFMRDQEVLEHFEVSK
jgi:hypothetical protein